MVVIVASVHGCVVNTRNMYVWKQEVVDRYVSDGKHYRCHEAIYIASWGERKRANRALVNCQ